ncbi:hypothetical protein BH11PAT2_BH11PAT2_08470 [soil metagenome]
MPPAGMSTSLTLTTSLLAAARSSTVEYAYEGPRHKFALPSANQHVLARKIHVALVADPSGRMAIDGKDCKLACGTPQDLLDMFQQNPDLKGLAPGRLDMLEAFVDGLTLQKAPARKHWMACKTGNGDAASAPRWNCLARYFHTGVTRSDERCFAVKDSAGITHCAVAEDCTNPVGRERDENGCVNQYVWMNVDDTLRGAPMAPAGISFPQGECQMLVQEPGSDEMANPPRDKCARVGCDFSEPARYLHMVVLGPQFSFKAKTAGWAIISLTNKVTSWAGVMEYCIEPADGTKYPGKDMHKTAYRNGAAYITYSAGQAPKDWAGLPHVWQEDHGQMN